MQSELREVLHIVFVSAVGIALAQSGCTTPSTDNAPATSDDVDNPAYATETPAPSLTIEDVATRIDGFTAAGVPSPLPVGLAFLAYLAYGDEDCPGAENELVNIGNEGCTTEEGWFYSGIGGYSLTVTDEGRGQHIAMAHGGDYRVASPDGDAMTGGGSATVDMIEIDGLISLSALFEGSFQDSQSSLWLSEGYSALTAYTADGPWGSITTELTGGVGIGGSYYVDFDHVISGQTTECPWEPAGDIGLRDDKGYWYVWHHEADCDPCGSVTFEPTGEVLGEVCVEMDWYFAELFLDAIPV